MRAICETDFAALAEHFEQIDRIADPIARLAATGRAYAEFGLRHPHHYRLMFMTPHLPHAPEDEAVAEKGNPETDAYAFLRAIVVEAMTQGRLRPEYHADYYGAYFRDPDGNKFCVACHAAEP